MSQSFATSQANQPEIEELMSEIAFQKVLLSSIDDSVENREEVENEVKAEIKALDTQLRALRRSAGTTTATTQSTSMPFSQPAGARTSSFNPRTNTTMDDYSTAGPQNGYQGSLLKFAFVAARQTFCRTANISLYFFSL
jgi:hypothetical protein